MTVDSALVALKTFLEAQPVKPIKRVCPWDL
jgi:hypothetical protein